eukprot:COSAG02_NODE_109_length_36250_cov_121.168903_20_plen_195_part_00
MAASFIGKAVAGASALSYMETHITAAVPALGRTTSIAIPSTFGAVILANVVGSSFTMLVLGMKVGKARKDVPDAPEYPQMYAAGDSENAKKFNCIQRGHQQALESWPSFLACSLVGGISFPLTTAALGAFWCKARLDWAKGYASGDPSKRYEGTGVMIWYLLRTKFVHDSLCLPLSLSLSYTLMLYGAGTRGWV